jgi:hypothetical protein
MIASAKPSSLYLQDINPLVSRGDLAEILRQWPQQLKWYSVAIGTKTWADEKEKSALLLHKQVRNSFQWDTDERNSKSDCRS